jgi:aminoglycoside phosphotransferase (APT) family kinase protein
MSPLRIAPWPLEADDLASFFARVESGVEFRLAFEELLCDLSLAKAEHLMLITRQGRAGWIPLLRTNAGRALVIGNAFSGAGPGLAQAGWEVVLRDDCQQRLAFALARAKDLGLELQTELSQGERHLPHGDESFDLIVRDGKEGAETRELARLARGEVVLIADNRYAYKRSVGVHGEFKVRAPLEYLRSLFSSDGQSLTDYAKELKRAGLVGLRPHSLYPHSADFTFCVSLSDQGPSLPIGPKERTNKLKILGQKLGLFPLLTPSYALISHKPKARLLRPLAERLLCKALNLESGQSPPLEHLVATRGNNALLLSGGTDPLALHLPLERRQQTQVKRHLSTLSLLREEFPTVPVPRPRGLLSIDGMWCAAEERLSGWTAGQICGDHQKVSRMLSDASLHLAALVTRPAQAFSELDYEELIGERVRRVALKARDAETKAALREMGARAREQLVGTSFPLVRSHGDLRSKHVQVDHQGNVLGYLDWGATEERDLPLFDLLHLIINERKQEGQLEAGEAWRLFLNEREGNLREYERAALEDYSQRLGLSEEFRSAIEGLYPLFVADAAEKNWDYSRPRWLRRQFGL